MSVDTNQEESPKAPVNVNNGEAKVTAATTAKPPVESVPSKGKGKPKKGDDNVATKPVAAPPQEQTESSGPSTKSPKAKKGMLFRNCSLLI